MLDGIPEDMKGESAILPAHPIFDTAEDATKLYLTDADHLHHFVAQLLYMSKQACPDIQLQIISHALY